jgi:hypothetical protein
MLRLSIVLLLASGLGLGAAARAAEVLVGPFSSSRPDGAFPPGWRIARLPGVTPTRFSLTELDGSTVVQMDAADAGASLYRPVRVDPTRTPVLRWRWRVGNLIQGADLRRKSGDDLPVRLYVMFDYDLERLSLVDRAKILLARSVAGEAVPAAALCYVWDGDLPEGTALWNAYTDRVWMIVSESGPGRVGQWVTEERDVAADFRAAFGEEPPPISGVAIAADTDQTGATVRAWVGDIRFADR